MVEEIAAIQTAAAQVIAAMSREPAHPAFVQDGVVVTCAQVLDTLGRAQQVLFGLGLGRGDAVAILTANRWETWCCTVAAHGLALRTTPLHPLGSFDDHRAQIEDAEINVLLVDTSAHAARGGEIAARVDGLKTVLTIGAAADYGLDLMAACQTVGASTARDLARPDDVIYLTYTGGTTGRAKGILRRQAAASACTATILTDFEFPDRPRYLAVAPLSHVSGAKVVPTLIRGGTVHLMRGFDPEQLLATIERERISATLLVPTMIYGLLDHPKLDATDLSSLELVLYGASPMSPTRLMEGLGRLGPVFSQLYGQSECYPIAVQRKADHDLSRPHLFAACGKPVSNAIVRLLDDDGQEVALGDAGEICVQSPLTMEAYWNQPELTAETVTNGWLHTGDVARRDEEGFLYIVDRKKDMIVTGGFNVYPREIEDVLTSHQAVAAAAVVGAPHDKWGEAVTAVVVRRPGAEVSDTELMALVKDRKGAVCAPKTVEFVDDLPMTPVGKVDKKILRARYWADRARMVG